MKRLPGYTLLKSGQWKTPKGGTISAKTYADHVARYQGYKNYADFRKTENTTRYEYFADIAYRNSGYKDDPYEVDSPFAEKYAIARASNFDPDADGPFAELLVWLDLRDDDDWWDVGETGEI